MVLPGATSANFQTALATLIDGDEIAQGDATKYEVDVYIAWTLNDGCSYSGWEAHAEDKKKGPKFIDPLKDFLTYINKLPSCTLLYGGEGCYGDDLSLAYQTFGDH